MSDVLAYRCTCVDGEVVTVLVAGGEPRLKSHPDLSGAYQIARDDDGAVIVEACTKVDVLVAGRVDRVAARIHFVR